MTGRGATRSHTTSAETITSGPKIRLYTSRDTMRDARISRGGIGIDSSSSLSLASKSCALAMNAEKMNITANAARPISAK